MKKALIISYHYPPMNVIAARRSEAYAMFLKQHNIFPTVVTHRWEMEDIEYDKNGKPISYKWKTWSKKAETLWEKNEENNIIRVPLYNTKVLTVLKFFNAIPFISAISKRLPWLAGLQENEVMSYLNMKDFLWNHLKENNYDVVIGIFSPHKDIKLACEISKMFKIPFIADYRDLWDNNLLADDNYEVPFKRKIQNYFHLKFHKKWLKKCLFYTAVSDPIVDKIAELCQVPEGYCITNGFEAGYFSSFKKAKNSSFTILHGGTVYEDQDITQFIDGMRMFWKKLDFGKNKEIKVVFLAIKSKKKQNQLNDSLPNIPIEFIDRLPREHAIQLMTDASILFYPSWQKFNGVYSGKLFEYLGTRNNILVIPKDNGVVEKLINKTGAGLATNEPKEAADFLYEKFNEWKTLGQASYNGIPEQVNYYSRENQVKKLANLISQKL